MAAYPEAPKEMLASASGRRLVRWVFYGGLALLLLVILTATLELLAPESMARRVSYNSEAYIFALVLAAWLQYGTTRIAAAVRLQWAVAFGGFWGLVGIGLVMSDLPSRIRTLNEAALALALLIPYVTLRRPLPRWTLLSVPVLVGVTAWAVVRAPESWIIDQAEAFGLIILAIITFDVIDRELLEPGRTVPDGVRWAWYAFLLLEPVVVSALGTDLRQDGGATALTLEYLGRVHESFVGVLLVVLILRVAPIRPEESRRS